MEKTEKPDLSRSVLAALFSGILAVCTAELYNMIYRGITHYNPSYFINVSSIIFGVLIAAMFAGVLFYFFVTYIKGGVYLFQLLFLILCVLLAVVAFRSHYGGNLPAFEGFSGLLFGIDVIMGIFIIILIPYFFKHNQIFMD